MTAKPTQQTFWPIVTNKQSLQRRISSLAPAKTTEVYDAYWRFAAERQAIFFRRLHGDSYPWTDDEILKTYKFTNAYRASDRVSQYLIRNVIYSGSTLTHEVFFRTILFKLFNKIETWELLKSEFGIPTYTEFRLEEYDRVLTRAMEKSQAIYSAAYIMPSGSRKKGSTKKHQSHLQLLTQMMEDNVPERIKEASSMRDAFSILVSYPMIGDFLAYQYITDINYSEICNFKETEFVVPGPGAIDGISKCFSSLGGLSETDIIKLVTDRQSLEFERLGIKFQDLWGRKLKLIDCQNLFCEISKYSRISHPNVIGIAKRTRIKQKYRANFKPIEYWYPPKWGINDLVLKISKINTEL